jgi:hypothetical protein
MDVRSGMGATPTVGLDELIDMPPDDLIATLHGPIPDYRSLYYRWEAERWEATAIELVDDAREWTEGASGVQQLVLWGLGRLEWVKHFDRTTASFVDAAPTEEQQVFLTTQLADEARHCVLLRRVRGEVTGSTEDIPVEPARVAAMVAGIGDDLRSDRSRMDELVRGLATWDLVLKAALAIPLIRFVVDACRRRQLLPGVRTGMMAMLRDEVRHVAFGLRLIEELRVDDGSDVLESALGRGLPIVAATLRSWGSTPGQDAPGVGEELASYSRQLIAGLVHGIGVSIE